MTKRLILTMVLVAASAATWADGTSDMQAYLCELAQRDAQLTADDYDGSSTVSSFAKRMRTAPERIERYCTAEIVEDLQRELQRQLEQKVHDVVAERQQIVEQMQPFIELGVDYFMVDCGGFPELTTLELLVNEVLPVLNN